MENRLRLIIIGFVLLLIGVAVPFCMVLGLFESTLFLNFVGVACSLAGFITGLIGIARYIRPRE